MPDASDELFNYATGFVTSGVIDAFAPCDPGYPNYVREWRKILGLRSLPLETNFDMTETIGLTRWADASRQSDSVRFRRFRVFTSAVALGMAVRDRANDEQFPPNYTLISLIDDAHALQDASLWKLLLPAFVQAYEAWTKQCSNETPFALLGLLLVNARQGASNDLLANLAEQLIDLESRCEHRVTAVFLFGCTYFDQLNHLWKQYITDLIKPVSISLGLVRDALLDGGPAGA